jgi:hypothetical protein
MKRKNNKPTYNGIEYDSNEEIEIAQWIEEAVQAGVIDRVEYQPESYILSDKKTMTIQKQLKTKVKEIEKHLLHPHRYTADFEFVITDLSLRLKSPFISNHRNKVVIDVKGGFNPHGGDREFAINQKWLYCEFGVYVNKVVPEKLFKQTWCPAKARLTPKTKQIKKKYAGMKSISEYLGANKCKLTR